MKVTTGQPATGERPEIVPSSSVSPSESPSSLSLPVSWTLISSATSVVPAHGVVIGWREHARTGIPVTVLTLVIAALWLWRP
jgi:hypothetical protein